MTKHLLLSQIYNRQTATGYDVLSPLPKEDPIMSATGKDYTNLRRLLYDPHVAAVVESRKAGVRSLQYELSTENVPKEVVRTCKASLENIDHEIQFRDDVVDTRLFGMVILETVFDYAGSKYLWRKIEQRNQEWFEFDSTNTLYFNPYFFDWLPCDENKTTLITSGATYSNPYGQAILSKIYWSVQYKLDLLKAWIQYADTFGFPSIAFKVPEGMKDNERQELEEAGAKFIQGGLGIFKKNIEVVLQEVKKSDSSKLFHDMIEFCNREISKAIIGQTLSTDIGTSGSYAAAAVHMEVRKEIVEADAVLIEKTMNKLLRTLVNLNHGKKVVAPTYNLLPREIKVKAA